MPETSAYCSVGNCGKLNGSVADIAGKENQLANMTGAFDIGVKMRLVGWFFLFERYLLKMTWLVQLYWYL